MTATGKVVDGDELDLLVDRAAAVDVGKASGMISLRLPHPSDPRRRLTKSWSVPSTTRAIMALAGELAEAEVERVVLEATSDYWRPFFYLFEAAGLEVWLVNAKEVKNVPGRPKTDKLDSVWLCKLNERGMLRPSFVPPVEIRQLRHYTRLRVELVKERNRHKQRIEKLLEDALIKLSSVATDIFGLSGRAMLDALISGERDPEVLAGLARGNLKAKHARLVDAFTGRFDSHHGELIAMLLEAIDDLDAKIERLTERIEAQITAIPAAQVPEPASDGGEQGAPAPLAAVARIDEVTGIGEVAAQAIIAEIGLDMSQFPTAAHLVSWAKVSPRTVQSGEHSHGGATGKGNPYLKRTLGQAAATVGRTDTFLGERYRRLVRRIGRRRALVALERSILVIIWHLLADPTARFQDLGPDYHERRVNKDRRSRDLLRQLRALGLQVTVQPAA